MAYETGEKIASVVPASNGTADHPIPASVLNRTTTVQKLVFGDGTEILGGSASGGANGFAIWVRIPEDAGYSFGQIVTIMSDKSKTEKIESYLPGNQEPDIYENFTALNTIETESSGTLMVRMTKE